MFMDYLTKEQLNHIISALQMMLIEEPQNISVLVD